MDSANVLIDTSIIIDHLRKQNKQATILYKLFEQYTLHVATIVEFELFVGAIDQQKQADVQIILQLCKILPFTSEAAQQAASIYQILRQQNQRIEIRDLFIAATALAFDLPLITLNTKHFERIPTLRLLSFP